MLAEQAPHTVLDPGALAPMGPNTLGNTCIAGWFNAGVPLAEIRRRCNFKDASVISRLGAHLVQPCLPAAWRCGKKAGTCSSASRTCKAIPET